MQALTFSSRPINPAVTLSGEPISTGTIVLNLINRVSELVIYYFKVLQSIGLILVSAKGILFDHLPLFKKIQNPSQSKSCSPVARAAETHFENIQNIKAQHFLGQGVIYGASGLISLGASLHELRFANLGSSYPIFHYGGSALFLFGSLFSLERNYRIYQEANKMEYTSWGDQNQLAQRIKWSAILGMLSDIASIIATAFSLFGPGIAVSLVLACFAMASVAVKTIYDFFFPT